MTSTPDPMTVAGHEPNAATRPARTPSVIVLGTDALLAALPATPVQLAHACLAAGYQQVVPGSWGDELVAQAVLNRLGEPRPGPAIQCSCPLVAHRVLASGTDLRPFLVSVVSPPVAVARYLRSVYASAGVRITYAGRCPGAVHDDIDARITPQELLAEIEAQGIMLAEQPRVFDSIVPPDRRRFYSQPGGLPTADQLWSAGGQRTLAELGHGDIASEIAELLLSGRNVLVDPSARLGCSCSGAVEAGSTGEARARVVAHEPPRAATAVVRPTPGLDLELPLPEAARSPSESSLPVARAREAAHATAPAQGEEERRVPLSAPRRRSPTHGIPRPVIGASPTARDPDGRQLPRTYVARRRSTPRPFRVQVDAEGESVTITESVAAVATPPEARAAEPRPEDVSVREREVQLLVTTRESNGSALMADQPPPEAPVLAATAAESAMGSPARAEAEHGAPGQPEAAAETAATPEPVRGAALQFELAEAAPALEPIASEPQPLPSPPSARRQAAPSSPAATPSAQAEVHEGPAAQPWERPPVRDREERHRGSPVGAERAAHAARVRRPLAERVVFPTERVAPVGTLRPSPRQLLVGLLLVALVIAASVTLGVVLGRWLAQPPAAAAGSRTPPATTPALTKAPRPTDSALIDAL